MTAPFGGTDCGTLSAGHRVNIARQLLASVVVTSICVSCASCDKEIKAEGLTMPVWFEGSNEIECSSKRIEAERIVVELDEEYRAGSAITATSHFMDEFTTSKTGVTHHVVISGLKAPGFLGFFYRNFGSSSIGNSFLESYKTYLEKRSESASE